MIKRKRRLQCLYRVRWHLQLVGKSDLAICSPMIVYPPQLGCKPGMADLFVCAGNPSRVAMSNGAGLQ
jgi:hypothetical protein